MLEAIAAQVDGTPCCTHIGPDGAGPLRQDGPQRHRVRRHAAHRRGVRPAPARGWLTSRSRSPRSSGTWNQGRLESYLIEITAEVLAHPDAITGKPFVDIVLDQAEQKGTGRWTVQDALDLGVPVSGIAEAVFARSLSGHADLRAAARGFPGPTPPAAPDTSEFADKVEHALYASKVVSYAQGWNMIAAGSKEYGWDIDLGGMAVDLARRLHHPR